MLNMIFHITTRAQWAVAHTAGVYQGDTLASEGFIHCSTATQLVAVANRFYRGQAGLVVLSIVSERVTAPIRYEPSGGEQFPHIYGPLNTDAVVQVVDFPPQSDGTFQRPASLV